tara:strand:- start:1553 stop:1663 length:111 start_codon:yes stop_codon:yes gene_type:complete
MTKTKYKMVNSTSVGKKYQSKVSSNNTRRKFNKKKK